jgi:hypothetical protein
MFAFPLVTSQFALHYAFRTRRTMTTFMLNVYQALKLGGLFIGTILDGRAVFAALSETPSGVEYSNAKGAIARFTPKFAATAKLLPYGQAIDVVIPSISKSASGKEEYLVDFQSFTDTMARDFDVVLLDDAAARAAGLPAATGMFDAATVLRRQSTPVLPKADMEYSRMHRWFIMTKTGPGSAAAVAAAMKLALSPSDDA